MLWIIRLLLIIVFFKFISVGTANAENDKHMLEVQRLYHFHEAKCLERGWKRTTVKVSGVDRQILWKAPATGKWENGAIVALHGGGGTYSNYCSNIRIGQPMVDFAETALQEGFAVFSPDSLRDDFKDGNGNACGKRWRATAGNEIDNHDLDLIRIMLLNLIPNMRTRQDNEGIFLTGISNGGFMTILAATQFSPHLTAFTPVSAGDPYGIRMDCDDALSKRKNAPGTWYDIETLRSISDSEACVSADYPHEYPWPPTALPGAIRFKQFHHENDGLVDLSCMKKVQNLLTRNGYVDDGEFLASSWGGKSLRRHFWISDYNQPMLAFFKKAGRL